jgi:hypothetical protein
MKFSIDPQVFPLNDDEQYKLVGKIYNKEGLKNERRKLCYGIEIPDRSLW